MAVETLEDRLRRLSRPGELVEKLPDGMLLCVACGHRCRIREGRAGVCRVRFNDAGVLRVPWGYVGALQLDPIEKKPFFHALPGAKALSFGMLGCDYHCHFCLPAGERVPTEEGMVPIESLGPGGPRVVTHRGRLRPVRRAFTRPYDGPLLEVRALMAPPVRATPDHPFLVWTPSGPAFRPAGSLRRGDLIAIPRRFKFSRDRVLHVAETLAPLCRDFKAGRRMPLDIHETVRRLARRGWISRRIAAVGSRTASHVRHIKRRTSEVLRRPPGQRVRGRLVIEDGLARFTKEHRPGIPVSLPWDKDLARLAGYYCAGGSMSPTKGRLSSAQVVWSFGPSEPALAGEVAGLVSRCFGLRPKRLSGRGFERVSVSKASLGALFEALCGRGARFKRVPAALFSSRREVVEAFVEAYARGDGWTNAKGQTTVSSVSAELAWGVAWLLVKLGRRPMLYSYSQPVRRLIQGRPVRQSRRVFVVRWPRLGKKGGGTLEDGDFLYVPLRGVRRGRYNGPVYNIEVSGDHTYLAGFLATHNCQNWVTSQAVRDPAAGTSPEEFAPEDLAALALKNGAPVIASTYNEPLITSEWAAAVFAAAREKGLKCAYISNGNGTPEVLRYLKPWVDFYKVDLKGFDDGRYRKIMGGTLKAVLDTIERLKAMGFWLEIVTLVIPTVNDSDEELRGIARFIAGVSRDIPWHATAFHQDYKMTDPAPTPVATLLRAAEIGKAEGLRYVYAGNLPGAVGPWEDTRCPGCGEALVERVGLRVRRVNLKLEGSLGSCPRCGAAIPGVWA